MERITDKVNLNNFGILFHQTKAMELFQKRSGMEGKYSVEYQYHYITLVGRLKADGQILDIAIPMCMFNYHQECSGAHIEFNLEEVSEANDKALVKAQEKFSEFETTDMYKELCDMGITDWTIHGMNNSHMHPMGVNSFSGTDLRTDIHHPGVVYPLSTGVDIPNFASMMQHIDQKAEMIISQYRIFNGVENGERAYQKGRCLTIVKGIPPIKTTMETIPNGAIDDIFGTTRPQPVIEIQKVRPSFWLRDGLTEAEGKLIGEELMASWEDCPFEIDVSLVLKTNIHRGSGRLLRKTTTSTWNKGFGHKNVDQYNNSLFGEEYDLNPLPPTKELSLTNMLDYLVEKGYRRHEMKEWNISEIADTYNLELEDAQADINAGITDITAVAELRQEIIDLIVDDQITSREKLMMMSDENLVKFSEEIYGKGIIEEIARGEH